MPYIYSTTTCDGTYVEYKPDVDKTKGVHEVVRKVTIKGGHGVATRHLTTPKGVVTQVSEDELEFLLKNQSFQKHLKDGFVSYDNTKVDPAEKAANMAEGDGAAPLVPADFVETENSTKESKIYKGRPKK